VAEYRHLEQLTKRAADLQEAIAGDHLYLHDVDDVAYEQARDELDSFAQQLQDRGVTEEDIELRGALIANPRYREPQGLGHVVIDNEIQLPSLDQEIDGDGISL
jgi:hypothetical protein